MWFRVSARLGKKLVRGAWKSSRERAAMASCSRRFASRLACAPMRRCCGRSISKSPLRKPALDLRLAVVAPERLAVHHDVGRAEHAGVDRLLVHLPQLVLPGRIAPCALGRVGVE